MLRARWLSLRGFDGLVATCARLLPSTVAMAHASTKWRRRGLVPSAPALCHVASCFDLPGGGQGSTVVPTILVTGVDEADWRDERSYDYTTGLTPREWAWEFLRRNPAFQRDLTAASQQADTLSYRPFLDVVASAGDLSRWGVLFRRVLWSKFVRFLVSVLVRQCAAGHCRTAVCIVGDIAVRALGIAMSCDGPAVARQGSACSSSQCGAYAPARRLWRRYLAPCLPPYRGNLASNAFEAPPEGTRVPQCSKFESTPACPIVSAGKTRSPSNLRSSCARRLTCWGVTSRTRRSADRSTARPCRLEGSSRSSARPHSPRRLSWPRPHEWRVQRFPSLRE
ncbi:conserved hypothetical protein [Mesorhizobium delmotii]|uniref:Transcriptional regulator-like domain-containing protein n=1 Tax=Mesorhizobium delmotii TaxID=1631247 RepID=A0A2P9AL41_9HYPH|nr:conserved hypothetical protein [Mesorhizobium delmotii]